MYFQTMVRQACNDRPGIRVFYRTKSGFSGNGLIDGYGDDGMRLATRGFTGVMSHKFVSFDSLEEILFDEGSRPKSIKEFEKRKTNIG